MNEYLLEIEKLLKHKEGLTTFDNVPCDIVMNNPASQKDIIDSEAYLLRKIPDDYKVFLSLHNGGILFKVEDFSGFKFLSANELRRQNTFQKENFGDDWEDDIVLFCMCIGDNEYLGFKIHEGQYRIVHCIMELLPDEWKIIGKSFSELCYKLIKEKGRKYWW